MPVDLARTSALSSRISNSLYEALVEDNGVQLPEEDPTIYLQVGERLFETRKSTVVWGSSYFKTVFKEPCEIVAGLSFDDPVFVDADSEMFVHILRYLRRGTCPLFWSKQNGFDYNLYTALQGEAEALGISSLSTWIAQQKYLDAVTVRQRARVVDGIEGNPPQPIGLGYHGGDVEVLYYPRWHLGRSQELKELKGAEAYACPQGISQHMGNSKECIQKCYKGKANNTYRCPRGIDVHMGKPQDCGRECESARRRIGYACEDTFKPSVLVVEKHTIFNKHVCRLDA